MIGCLKCDVNEGNLQSKISLELFSSFCANSGTHSITGIPYRQVPKMAHEKAAQFNRWTGSKDPTGEGSFAKRIGRNQSKKRLEYYPIHHCQN